LELPARRPAEGDFVAWNGGCLMIGTGPVAIAPHAHYAIQWVIGAPAGLRVQFGRKGAWQPCAAALVPSRATHTIDVTACEWQAVLFFEPETPQGRAISARLQGGLERLDAEATAVVASRLDRAWRIERSADAVRTVCLQLVRELSRTEPRDASDPRILAAMEAIRQAIDQPVTLEAVARAAHLSPSRFRHLFVQQTGMPLRSYVLWRRVLRVWELVVQGETLSHAAHAAGFADSAHLSRTARSMFGVPPSALQMNGPLSARIRAPHQSVG